MPRQKRVKSSTGVYHIILRGINRQRIFQDDQDYKMYLKTLFRYRVKSKYKIYAYCLMSNHIHFLMQQGKEDFGIVFQRIGASYVYWYNLKYERQGHLFQGRYISEAVETEKYLLTALRYIHQNPLKAGMVTNIAKYKWSSYNDYIGNKSNLDTEFILNLFSKRQEESIRLFVAFNRADTSDVCLELNQKKRWKDPDAVDFIKNISGLNNSLKIKDLEVDRRDNIIRECRKNGLSIRQIERLTGISFGLIRNIGV